MEIDPTELIAQVQLYPVLYDTSDDKYKDKTAKMDAWIRVAEGIMGKQCGELDYKKQREIGKEMQRKWKIIRDTFVRTLKLQDEKSESGTKRFRRPYVYFKQMSFLLPVLLSRPATEETEETKSLAGSESQANSSAGANAFSLVEPPRPKRAKRKTLETQLLQPIKTPSNPITTPLENNIDPDKMFLLSILPKIKELNPSSRFDFQIKCMQLLQTYFDNPNCTTNPISSTATQNRFNKS